MDTLFLHDPTMATFFGHTGALALCEYIWINSNMLIKAPEKMLAPPKQCLFIFIPKKKHL